MRLMIITEVLVILCISVGDGLSILPQCVQTLVSCTSTSGCPSSHPVCENGICCLGSQVEKVCPQDPPMINYMCTAEFLPDECSSDKDCPTGEKCCFLACGPRKCHTAVLNPSS